MTAAFQDMGRLRIPAVRHLLALGALALAGACAAREVDPARFSGDDQTKIEKAFAAAVAEPGSIVRLDRRRWKLSRTVVVEPLPGEDRVAIRVWGSREWSNVEYSGEGPAFRFVEFKDCDVRGLGIRGGGIEFVARRSSARVTVEACRVELAGTGTAFLFTDALGAMGAADMSVYAVRDCEASKAATGFRWVGPNNLDPSVSHSTATDCAIGFDLREGGSNAVLHGVGGSFCGELVAVNGGYQVDVLVQSAEHCGTVFRTGGDDAGGHGQPTPQDFRALSVRDCTGPWLVVNKAGRVRVQASSLIGKKEATAENRSAVPLVLSLSDEAVGEVASIGIVTIAKGAS